MLSAFGRFNHFIIFIYFGGWGGGGGGGGGVCHWTESGSQDRTAISGPYPDEGSSNESLCLSRPTEYGPSYTGGHAILWKRIILLFNGF